MRKGTICADLVAIFVIPAVSAALLAQRVQGAIAEQAVELRLINAPVTGKIPAFPVLEELMVEILIFCVHSKTSFSDSVL